MLSKSKRLSKLQFDDVFKKGRVFHSPLFVIRVLSESKDIRFSAVSSKKVDNTAVKRNSSRRKIYNTTRVLSRNVTKPVWVLIFAKKSLKDIPQDEVVTDLKGVFVKSKILE